MLFSHCGKLSFPASQTGYFCNCHHSPEVSVLHRHPGNLQDEIVSAFFISFRAQDGHIILSSCLRFCLEFVPPPSYICCVICPRVSPGSKRLTVARVPGQAPNLLDIVTATVGRRSRRQTYDPASSLPQGEVSCPPTRRRDPHATRHTIPVRTKGEWVRQRGWGIDKSEVRETAKYIARGCKQVL